MWYKIGIRNLKYNHMIIKYRFFTSYIKLNLLSLIELMDPNLVNK